MDETYGTPLQPEMARAYLESTQFRIQMLSLASSCGNHCGIFRDVHSDIITPPMRDCLKSCVGNFERTVSIINKSQQKLTKQHPWI